MWWHGGGDVTMPGRWCADAETAADGYAAAASADQWPTTRRTRMWSGDRPGRKVSSRQPAATSVNTRDRRGSDLHPRDVNLSVVNCRVTTDWTVSPILFSGWVLASSLVTVINFYEWFYCKEVKWSKWVVRYDCRKSLYNVSMQITLRGPACFTWEILLVYGYGNSICMAGETGGGGGDREGPFPSGPH